MKMLGKLARSLAARYVCQNCEKEKERRAVAHNATKCLERNTLLAESNQPRPSRSTASKKRWRKQSWNATLHGKC